MSAASAIPARRRLTVSPQRERRRAFIDKAFRVVGFAATFFGLGMLVIFLGDLAADTVHWFNMLPERIEARNTVIQQRVDEAEKIIQAEMAKIEKEKQQMLATAKTAEEKKEIEDFYTKEVVPVKLGQYQQRAKEYESDLRFIRTDTSPPALLAHFLTNGPSDQPQDAGIKPALLGSIWLVAITAFLAVPLGVGAAIYLEEYSSRNWLAKIIQLNISNLAGVPSVVFGILGAFVFVGLIFHPLEENYPWIAARNVLGGGMTLALLTLPIVIVSAQEAIRAVPQSIRHGAYALGATHWQVTWTVVLPNAVPGILTGTILSMSRAIGEAAPLVLFGALLFVNQDPELLSRFTILPMQIFNWADRPEEAWRYNAAVASVILLLTLLLMNAIAIFLRQRGQRHMKW